MACSDRMLVVAIDFGTTFSGYAFSFVNDFQSSPLKVETLNVKNSYGQMAKVPTSVLFDPQQQFHSFGVEAEEEYARMSEEDMKEARKWFYFERFKMTLYNNSSLDRDMKLMDQTRKKGLPALTVFSAAIAHLKQHFWKTLEEKKTSVQEDEITWVLTIPAIWEDQARQFMREAAGRAGIPAEQLVLALEPEAASVYCLAFCKANPRLVKPFSVDKGAKFMLVDCGGGTIDISVLEVEASGRLRHLHRPAGTADGGVSVDRAFKAFLGQLVGFDGLTAFDAMEMLALRRHFERTKRSFSAANQKAHIEVPSSVQTVISVSLQDCDNFRTRVSLIRNRLMLDGDLFFSFYDQSVKGITAAIRHALGTNKVDAIFLAGGFSESDIIQNAVQEEFPEVQVVTAQSVSQSVEGCRPFSGVGAVLMGAVMYGHDPQVIATRVSAYTYGVETNELFQEGVHEDWRAVNYDDGKKRCKGCFDVHIRVGQEVAVNTLLPFATYVPAYIRQTDMPIRVFRTAKERPLYVDEEGVDHLGTMTVLMPDFFRGITREIEAAMQVGGTELRLVARNPVTREQFSTTCEFLSRD